MSRNALHRDFNLCKAVVLAGLIGAAMLIGDMPGHERGETAAAPYDEVVLPASYRVHDASQDVAGVAL